MLATRGDGLQFVDHQLIAGRQEVAEYGMVSQPYLEGQLLHDR